MGSQRVCGGRGRHINQSPFVLVAAEGGYDLDKLVFVQFEQSVTLFWKIQISVFAGEEGIVVMNVFVYTKHSSCIRGCDTTVSHQPDGNKKEMKRQYEEDGYSPMA